MKILVQWAVSPVGREFATDSADWPTLASKPEPRGGEVIDSVPGWINAIDVQGNTFIGQDHTSVEDLADGSCRVYEWKDDRSDHPERFGSVWTIRPLRRDSRAANHWNTNITVVHYADGSLFDSRKEHLADCRTTGGPVLLLPFSEFPTPNASVTRHGIWLDNTDFNLAMDAIDKAECDWKRWTDGVPESDIEDGRVK